MGIFATYNNMSGILPVDVVTASSNIADEAIVRGDGGARGVQDSLVFINNAGEVTGATLLSVDNITINGNAITSTNVNGAIEITPNGTGKVIVSSLTGLMASDGATGIFTRSLTQPSAGITITNADGTAGNPTFALDDDLAALEALATTGMAARTAASTWATRTITQPAAGITVADGDGVAGNPTLALADDLAALEALATTGIAARTGASTWSVRTLTAGSSLVNITNGDGVAGNPTIDVTEANININNLSGTLTVAKGGTGATTSSDARTNLGVAIGSDVEAWDADLDALAALATTGMMARTSAATYATRTITQPAAGITVSNGDGVAGNPTLALADDLSAVEGIATSGIVARTASNTWTTRTITGTSNEIDVSNGDGVSGNPTIGLVASPYVTSISFDSGSNFLDYYEEGTWTPTITSNGTPPTSVGYNVNTGYYTRVGDLVTVSAFIQVSSITLGPGTGAVRIAGLPFTVKNVSALYWVGAVEIGSVNLSLSGSYLTANAINNTTQAQLIQCLGNTGATDLPIANVAQFDIYRTTITYKV